MENLTAQWTRDWAKGAGLSVWFADATDSTNRVAKDDESAFGGATAGSLLAPVLYLTAHQTAGRGRNKNTWTDTTTGALLSSWSFRMALPPQPIFSPLAGLAVYKAAISVWPDLPWSLKAPNDLYLDGRKVAGILIETIDRGSERRTIVGLGMNVFSAPADVPTAIALNDVIGRLNANAITFELWSRFLQSLLVNFMANIPAGQKDQLSSADATALKAALNKNPHLKEAIERVGPHVQLHTASGVVDWTAL